MIRLPPSSTRTHTLFPYTPLVRSYKGARVTAVDIEPQLLERGRRFAEKAGVADRVDFRLVEPGPLPFAAGRFDAVFSKDALIHIPDKPGLYAAVRSEEPTSELQSLIRSSYAVF